jgi:hypothetical protein
MRESDAANAYPAPLITLGRGDQMNMAEEKPQVGESIYHKVRRAAREKEEKEAERMRRFDELLGRKGQQDELSKKLGR